MLGLVTPDSPPVTNYDPTVPMPPRVPTVPTSPHGPHVSPRYLPVPGTGLPSIVCFCDFQDIEDIFHFPPSIT